MKTSSSLSPLLLLAGIHVGSTVAQDACVTTQVLPRITVTTSACPGMQTQTITNTVKDVPPVYTTVTIGCSACNNGQPVTETVTCPPESVAIYTSAGYTVVDSVPTPAVVTTTSNPDTTGPVYVSTSEASSLDAGNMLSLLGGVLALMAYF